MQSLLMTSRSVPGNKQGSSLRYQGIGVTCHTPGFITGELGPTIRAWHLMVDTLRPRQFSIGHSA